MGSNIKSMNIFLTVLIVIFSSSFIFADGNYAVKNIPAGLREDAGAVIRVSSTIFEVSGLSALKKVKYAVTIFNKDNEEYGSIDISYSKFSSIEELEGKIFDSEGEEVRELDDKDIKDYSDFGGSLYDDNRVRTASLYYNKFPYTIEFTYEISYDGFLNWPKWHSRNNIDPVELSIFEVKLERKLRYWTNRADLKPEILNDGSYNSYKWRAVNQPKLSHDAVSEDIEDVADVVLIGPSEFEIEGEKGEMTSWSNFGKWFYGLYKDRQQLPENAVREVKKLIAGLDNDKEKIEQIYKYMQARTRYISVQFGIGGWQPFDAQFVHERRYGDCKALSNYMVSLLKEGGITAYPVLIRSGQYRLPMITEFPSNQFNHVVVCVPGITDTTWLECTSQIMPPGEIGYDNENRQALMVTPNGGIVVNTPVTTSKQNLQVKNIEVKLTTKQAEVNGKVIYEGNQQGYMRPVFCLYTPEEKEKWLLRQFEVPSVNVNKYSFDTIPGYSGKVKLEYDLVLPNYVSVSGNRIFFNPNILERVTSVPKDVEKRLSPVRRYYPFLDVDSVSYSLPEGYEIEALPEETVVKSSFGEFSSRAEVSEGKKILFVRSMEMREYVIPAANYPEYREVLYRYSQGR